MTIRVSCPECSQVYQVADDKAGRRFRCKKCDGLVDVPLAEDDFGEGFDEESLPPPRAQRTVAKPSKKSKKSSSPARFGPQGYWETIKKFGQTEGRANRTEYWNLQLFNLIIYVFFGSLMLLIDDGDKATMSPIQVILGIAALTFLAGVFVPTIATGIRRLHDTDRSEWWFLVIFIPIGGLIFIVLTLLPGTPGKNRYGSAPA